MNSKHGVSENLKKVSIMAKKTLKLELSEVMVCKDVQENTNGTFSLLGVYPKDIAISAQPPTNLQFSLWMNFMSVLPEDALVEVKISGKGVLEEDVVIPVNIAAQKDVKGIIAVPIILKKITLRILGAGEIKVFYKTPKARWMVARVIELKVA